MTIFTGVCVGVFIALIILSVDRLGQIRDNTENMAGANRRIANALESIVVIDRRIAEALEKLVEKK